LAAGFQGLAPHWFELSATAYLGESGMLGFRGEGEYDLRLSRRVYLQPRISMDWYSQSDRVNRRGEGLAELAAGLRLRYEFSPRFAPYVGVSWQRNYGDTGDLLVSLGEPDESSRWVFGLRFWL
jgi:copper resistance protein B